MLYEAMRNLESIGYGPETMTTFLADAGSFIATRPVESPREGPNGFPLSRANFSADSSSLSNTCLPPNPVLRCFIEPYGILNFVQV